MPDDYVRRKEMMNEGLIGAKTYPASYEYEDVDLLWNVALFAREPWFDTAALDKDGFYDRHKTNGLLHCDVPLHALKKFACRSYLSCNDGDMIIGHGRTLQQQRESFI